MNEKQLEAFKSNPGFLSQLTTALSILHQTGVLAFLRDLGRVKFVTPKTDNYVAVQAASMSESLGYNAALDNLTNFREYFLEPETPKLEKVTDLYGALDRTVESGDLTKEEADAIRTNSPIPEPVVTSWADLQRARTSAK